LKEDTQIKEQ